jgi:hypothetical protein
VHWKLLGLQWNNTGIESRYWYWVIAVVDAFGYENKELHEGFGIGACRNKEKGDESSRIFLTCS